jgi:cyclic-di-GMP-binding protein
VDSKAVHPTELKLQENKAMPSFDIVSRVDMAEIDNAVNQASKEVSQRYDLKKIKSSIEYDENKITVTSEDEFSVRQVIDVLQTKLVKRKVPLKALTFGEAKMSGISKAVSEISLQQGIDQDNAKKMVKQIKGLKLKVQAQIMGDQLRISGKKRDDLQQIIAFYKEENLDYHVDFVNFRD